jgi:hypothetical protein
VAFVVLWLVLVLWVWIEQVAIRSRQAKLAELAAIAGLQAYAESTAPNVGRRKEIAAGVVEQLTGERFNAVGKVQAGAGEARDRFVGMIRFGTWVPASRTFTEVAPDGHCNSVSIELPTKRTSPLTAFLDLTGASGRDQVFQAKAYYKSIPGLTAVPRYYLVSNPS